VVGVAPDYLQDMQVWREMSWQTRRQKREVYETKKGRYRHEFGIPATSTVHFTGMAKGI